MKASKVSTDVDSSDERRAFSIPRFDSAIKWFRTALKKKNLIKSSNVFRIRDRPCETRCVLDLADHLWVSPCIERRADIKDGQDIRHHEPYARVGEVSSRADSSRSQVSRG